MLGPGASTAFFRALLLILVLSGISGWLRAQEEPPPEDCARPTLIFTELIPEPNADGRIIVDVGLPLSVAVEVTSGEGPFTFRWYRDSVLLEAETSRRLERRTAELEDAGNYFLQVIPACGEASAAWAPPVPVEVLARPPVFQQFIGAVEVAPGEPWSLQVISAAPVDSFLWLRDGKPLDATGDTLEIAAITPTDEGVYTVRMTNVFGETTSPPFTLDVVPAQPRILAQPEDVTLGIGRPHTFRVLAEGRNLRYQWFRNGRLLDGATASTLTLAAVALQDVGYYTVRVSNDGGSQLSRPARLEVFTGPPFILTHPQDQAAQRGEAVSFSVEAGGSGMLTYRWQRNGLRVDDGEGPGLVIDPVTPADFGTYTVVVRNAFGQIESEPAVLTEFVPPPVVVTPPTTVRTRIGLTATLSVEATGPDLVYTWTRDGFALPADGPTLLFAPVTAAAIGTYQVTVSNRGGSITTPPVRLELTDAPIILAHPDDVTAPVGSRVVLAAVVDGANLQLQWERDGAAIPGATGDSLILDPLTVAQTGLYQLRARNAAGTTVTNVARVFLVGEAPRLLTAPGAQEAIAGDDVALTALARGPDLNWFWEQQDDTGRFAVRSTEPGEAVIHNISIDDAGTWRVRVRNPFGEVRSELFALAVAPTGLGIIRHPRDTVVTRGESAVLAIDLLDPEATVQWWRDNAPLPGATGRELILTAATDATAGLYLAEVTTASGRGFSRGAEVTVVPRAPRIVSPLEPPLGRIFEPDPITGAGQTVVLAVTAAGRDLRYQWSRDGVALPASNQPELRFSPVTLADAGAYAVEVRNAGGLATSGPVTLPVYRQPPVIIDDLPAEVSAPPAAALTLAINAVGSDLRYQWYRLVDGVETPVAGATGPSLTFPALTADEMGYWFVAVDNRDATLPGSGAERWSRLTEVRVREGVPQIIAEPQDITVAAGEAAALTVRAAGIGLQYQWHRDNEPVPGAVDATLRFPAVRPTDAGRYRCEVRNAFGTRWSRAAELAVLPPPPRILQEPADVVAAAGGSATFRVTAEGATGYTWFVDGVATGPDRPELVLQDLVLGVRRTIRVEARNAGGMTPSAPARLRVVAGPPEVLRDPAPAVRLEGETVVFSADIDGVPPFTWSWERNGVALAGATAPTLTLGGLQVADAGRYRVVVRNAYGVATTAEAQLTVERRPPVFRDLTGATTVREGLTLSLEASFTGTNLTFSWLKEGSPVPGADQPQLVRDPVTRHDGGLYRAVARNEAGQAVSPLIEVIVVSAAPRITSTPPDQTVQERDDVILRATAAGPDLTWQWQFAGADLPAANEPVLHLPGIGLAEAGAYRVVVRNPWGEAVSDPIIVTVLLAPPEIAANPLPASAREGESATFAASVIGSDVELQWESVEGPLAPEPRLSGLTTAQLVIADLTRADANRYRLRARNDAGEAVSAFASLEVLSGAPRLEIPPADLTVDEFASARFVVAAAGRELQWQWWRDDAEVPGANGPELLLPTATLGDAGTYRVQIRNIYGSIMSPPATLTVVPAPPRVVTQPTGRTVRDGEAVVFSARAEGSGRQHRWWRDGQPLPTENPRYRGVTGAVLSIDPVAVADAGTYQLVVRNASGEARSEPAVLTVLPSTPVIRETPEDTTVLAGDAVTLAITATGGALTYAWTRDGAPLPGVEGPVLEIERARSADSGAYAVRVRNSVGEATAGPFQVVVHANPPRLLSPLYDQSLLAGSDLALSVEAAGYPLTYTWFYAPDPSPDSRLPLAATTATYMVPAVTPMASGYYTVVVSGEGGPDVSSTAEVVVYAVGYWPGTWDLGNGWHRSPWWGSFSIAAAPWFFHGEHGFLYVTRDAPDDLVYYQQDAGWWLWTSQGVYPWLYRFGPDPAPGWLRYAAPGSEDNPGPLRQYLLPDETVELSLPLP